MDGESPPRSDVSNAPNIAGMIYNLKGYLILLNHKCCARIAFISIPGK
jgi:hypothetical protein